MTDFPSGGCPFCDFDEPPVTIYADVLVQAFVSRSPINGYHVVVTPRVHYERLTELPGPTLAAVFGAAQRISAALAAAARPDAITLMSDDDLAGAGFNLIAHWKLHLIPRYRDDAVVIEWHRTADPGPEVRAAHASALRDALGAVGDAVRGA